MTKGPVLAIDGLSVTYATPRGRLTAVNSVSLAVGPGETLAIVGESGSGKSSIALAVMALLNADAHVTGKVSFLGDEISNGRSSPWVRGADLTIVFQDPFTALNPALPIGTQVAEPLIYHRGLRANDARERTIAALTEVGLTDPRELLTAYPHQLSGGMQQRILIATALICDPSLIILDEPTTALDVTVEALILDLLERIREHRRLSMLYISHNIGVVNRIADRVAVLYAGQVVESGPTVDILRRPAHPYTMGLLACLPQLDVQRKRLTAIPGRLPDLRLNLTGCVFAPRCPFVETRCTTEHQDLDFFTAARAVRCWKHRDLLGCDWPALDTTVLRREASRTGGAVNVTNLAKTYLVRTGGLSLRRYRGIPLPMLSRREVRAVDGVSFTIEPGEILGLVGESGSGKSTLGRLVLRLALPTTGEVRFNGRDIARISGRDLQKFRRAAQLVFQNPDSSLNPRCTVGRAIERALELHTNLAAPARRAEVVRLLDRVGLPPTYVTRYPHQLSGGEKQRVGIARALATGPSFLVCDEPVSALDVSVRATVLNVLSELRDSYGLSYLFISHDLAVVAHLADRIAVMFAGRIVELGPTEAILSPPYHPYTEALLTSVPLLHPSRRPDRSAGPPETSRHMRRLAGCPFHQRCPHKLGDICETVMPPQRHPSPRHRILCHIPLADLAALPSTISPAVQGKPPS